MWTHTIGLAIVNEMIVRALSEPIKVRFPDLDTWWLVYVAMVTGTILGLASGVNVFGNLIDNFQAGVILTSIIIGCGSNFVHEIYQRMETLNLLVEYTDEE